MAQPKKTPCMQYCMYYLSRFPKTTHELRIKLLEKWYPEAEIDQAIDFLTAKDYINDAKFIEAYVQSDIIRKWKVAYLVKQKLRGKWLDMDLIESIFNQFTDEIHEATKSAISKHIDKLKARGLEGFDIIQKLMAKGFSLDLIKKVIRERQEEK